MRTNDSLTNCISKIFYSDPDLFNRNGWDLEAYTTTILYFFISYKNTFKVKHPYLSVNKTKDVMLKLSNDYYKLSPEETIYFIDEYFKTNYKNCNYSILHFVAGDIRLYLNYKLY